MWPEIHHSDQGCITPPRYVDLLRRRTRSRLACGGGQAEEMATLTLHAHYQEEEVDLSDYRDLLTLCARLGVY